MALFAASLSTFKKRASTLASEFVDEVKSRDLRSRVGLEENGPPSRETQAALRTLVQRGPQGAYLTERIVVVRYEVQNVDDGEREMAAFPLVASESTITAQHVRRQFPVPGRFHLRFKAPSLGGSFGDFLWMDLANHAEAVPMWRGDICVKALRLPNSAGAAREFGSVPDSTLAAMAEATSAVPRLVLSPPAAPSPALGSPGGPSPPGTPGWQGSDDARPAASLEPEDQEQAPPRPPPPPPDLLGVSGPASAPPAPSLESAAGGPAGAPAGGAAGAPAGAPPPARAQPDHEVLVEMRLAAERKRVDDRLRETREQRRADEQFKADKVAAGARIDAEMARWARTPDGQAYKDVKVLLSTLHTVTWPGCRWEEVPLSQLISGGSEKAQFRKALRIFHADKTQGAAADQQVRADRIFQALTEAYAKHQ